MLAKHLNSERKKYETINKGASGTPAEFYTAPELEVAVHAVTSKVLKTEAYRNQVKYLQKTKKLVI